MYENPYIVNANEMGLGKTMEAIAIAELTEAKKILVVCPNTVKDVWTDELEKWGDKFSSVVIRGNRQKRLEQFKEDVNFYIINWLFRVQV